MRKKHIGLIVRLVVSVVGIALVIRSVPIGDAWDSLLNVQMGGVLVALVLFQLGIVVRSLRWWLLLRSHSETIPFMSLIRLYYVGMFFNLFLPTGFGGDVVRAAELGTHIDRATAAATVLLDRMLGLMGLFVIALVAAPFAIGTVPQGIITPALTASIIGLIGGLLVIQGRIFGAILQFINRLLGRFELIARIIGAFETFNNAIARVGKDPVRLWGSFVVSMGFNVILIIIHIMVSNALGLDVPAIGYALIVSLTSILLLVPSIGGVGVREASTVGMLKFFTDSPASAALAVLILLLNVLAGVVGWVLYVIYSLRKPDTDQQPAATS